MRHLRRRAALHAMQRSASTTRHAASSSVPSAPANKTPCPGPPYPLACTRNHAMELPHLLSACFSTDRSSAATALYKASSEVPSYSGRRRRRNGHAGRASATRPPYRGHRSSPAGDGLPRSVLVGPPHESLAPPRVRTCARILSPAPASAVAAPKWPR